MRHRGLLAVMFLLLTVVLGACGSSNSSSTEASTHETSSEVSGTKDDSSLKESAAKLAATYASTNTPPPAAGPKAVPGKKVTAIVYGLEAESGKTFAEGFERATKAIGWSGRVVDGEFSANKYLESVRKAVAEKVDGIVTYVIDCPSIQAGAQEAKSAGIPLVYDEGFDCNEIDPNGPETGYKLGTYHTFSQKESGDFQEYIEAAGELQAAAAIQATEGKTSAIVLNETDARVTEYLTDGFLRSLSSCGECSVDKQLNWVGGDLGSPLQEKVEQALLQAPEANVLMGNYDDPVVDSAAPAVRAAGRTGSIYVTGTAGYEPMMELIRNEEADMTVGLPVEWFAWAGVDRLNRIFGGEEKLPETGIGLALIDKEHNLPPEGQAWKPNIDFESAYRKAWGLG